MKTSSWYRTPISTPHPEVLLVVNASASQNLVAEYR